MLQLGYKAEKTAHRPFAIVTTVSVVFDPGGWDLKALVTSRTLTWKKNHRTRFMDIV
jgi:leucyl aminopeptidase